ncbi:MAG: hypothetical protein GKS06_00865 [Acidobacteria bacterium]|nr:hypothetical protein [Acidobacteriota bacterium]
MTEHDLQLEQLLRDKGRSNFGPGFADRVMRRVEEEPVGWIDSLTLPDFVRFAAAALVLAVALAVFSLSGSSERSQTALEAVLGLDPVTATSIYDAQALMPAASESAS